MAEGWADNGGKEGLYTITSNDTNYSFKLGKSMDLCLFITERTAPCIEIEGSENNLQLGVRHGGGGGEWEFKQVENEMSELLEQKLTYGMRHNDRINSSF